MSTCQDRTAGAEHSPSPTAPSTATVERPILVVSNRLPVTVNRGPRGIETKRSSGGLVSALEPLLRERGGKWIGWPGVELRPREHLSTGKDSYEIEPVRLTAKEIEQYYHGFCNRTLWPILHGFLERARFSRVEWETYQRVNARFAEVAGYHAEGIDLVWFHDYHLMVAPFYLRHAFPQTRIAFFLHIPFPPYDWFRLLPWARELILGLLACDLIGFHINDYATNFLNCAERLLGVRVDAHAGLVEHRGRAVRVGAFPLGIDFQAYESQALAAPPTSLARNEQVVLGVDRLDYTKGIPERILAFERLLELHSEHRGKVILFQLALPSRFEVAEYRKIKREVDELVGRVNGRFASAQWSPIRYLYRTVPPDELAGLYRDADVALVTPLRDGMNLVGKEFVACQVARLVGAWGRS